MHSGLAARTAATLARVLLLLYPPSFRREVGHALVEDVRQRGQELSGARAGLWLLRLLTSLLFNALAAWFPRAARTPLVRGAFVSWLDLKLGLRMLVKYPGLTLTGGLGIAVAIAIGVGFFVVMQSRFFPVIPLSDGDRLVVLSHWDRRTNGEAPRSVRDYAAWREGMKSVQDMTAFRTVTRNVIGQDGSIDLVEVAEITPSGFRLARVPPLLGRSLVEADASPGAPPVIVIGFDVWQSRFAGTSSIVGRTLRLGRTVHTVVGVMPEGFAFPVDHRYWTALKTVATASEDGNGPSISVAGRLAPGYDAARAQAELSVIVDRMAASFSETHGQLRAEVMPYGYIGTGMTRSSSDGWWAMAVLASLLLVVVCVNIAILVYARTATRMGEIAVRSALGASRARIVVQLTAESLVLSAGAAGAGLFAVTLLFAQMTRMKVNMEGVGSMPFWLHYRISGPGLVYFIVLTLTAALITGVIPALRATGRRVDPSLRQFNSRSGLRLGRTWTTLIVVQVAVASAALPIAIAMGWLQIRDVFRVPNFPVDQVLFARLALHADDGESSGVEAPARFARLQAELSRKLDAESGVVNHCYSVDVPVFGVSSRVAVASIASAPEAAPLRAVQRSTVDLAFLETFELDVLSGRGFEAADRDRNAADVVLVNRAFVSRVFGGADPVGRRVRFVSENATGREQPEPERWYEIVGVVENIDANPYARDRVDARVYHPMQAVAAEGAGLAVRSASGDQAALAQRVREIAVTIDPALSVKVVPLAQVYRAQRTALSSAAIGLGVALLSVLLLSAAGIYALMSFTVTQRRREIAIRTALGAEPRRLLRGIFSHALRQISIGVGVGLGIALVLDASADGEALRGHGPVLLTAMVAIMAIVGLAAALGPARRGLQIEPSEALKAE